MIFNNFVSFHWSAGEFPCVRTRNFEFHTEIWNSKFKNLVLKLNFLQSSSSGLRFIFEYDLLVSPLHSQKAKVGPNSCCWSTRAEQPEGSLLGGTQFYPKQPGFRLHVNTRRAPGILTADTSLCVSNAWRPTCTRRSSVEKAWTERAPFTSALWSKAFDASKKWWNFHHRTAAPISYRADEGCIFS